MELLIELVVELIIEGFLGLVYYIFNRFFKTKVTEKTSKAISLILAGLLVIVAFSILIIILTMLT